MMNRLYLLAVVGMLSLGVFPLVAQESAPAAPLNFRPAAPEPDGGEGNPLGFRTEFPRVGVEGGVDLTKQDGMYDVGCGHFTEGSGVNLSMAVAWDKPFDPEKSTFRVEGIIGYRQRNVSGSYQRVEPSIIRNGNGTVQPEGEFVEADITYNNVGEAQFSYLFVQPSIKFYPTDFFYCGVGFNAGLKVGSRTQYTKEIVTQAVTLENGDIIEAFYPSEESSDPHSKIFPVETPENSSALLFDPVGFAGFEFRFGREFFAGPRVTYGLPVMSAISDPALKFSSLQISLGVRYNLR